jgi:hypothetical protein
MVQKREAYAPWSLTRKAGVQSATVNGDIEVPQFIQPTLDTGFVDEDGNWQGVKSSDSLFRGITTHEAVANSGVTLSPQTENFTSIDMTGYSNIFIAIKPTNGGNYATNAVMGPDDKPFANLSPVDAAVDLRGCIRRNDFDSILVDSADSLTADVWNIFIIVSQLQDQKHFQFKVVNNSGAESTIQVAFMRLV